MLPLPAARNGHHYRKPSNGHCASPCVTATGPQVWALKVLPKKKGTIPPAFHTTITPAVVNDRQKYRKGKGMVFAGGFYFRFLPATKSLQVLSCPQQTFLHPRLWRGQWRPDFQSEVPQDRQDRKPFCLFLPHTWSGRDETTQDKKFGTFFWTALTPALTKLYNTTTDSPGLQRSKEDFAAFCPELLVIYKFQYSIIILNGISPQQNHKCVISIISSLHGHYRNQQISRYRACLTTALTRKHCQMAVGQDFVVLQYMDPTNLCRTSCCKITATNF